MNEWPISNEYKWKGFKDLVPQQIRMHAKLYLLI